MSAPNPNPGIEGSSREPSPGADRRVLGSLAVLAAGTVAVYSRTFSVPLLLDDLGSIADNPSIRSLWPLGPALSPPDSAGVGGRPLLNLTYALNYASGGTSVAGYHCVNLAIHVLAAWLLFDLVRRILLRPVLAERFGGAATPLALAVAALWAWHPLQTESVTYLTQRSESLMGLLYLATLDCFLRGTEARGRAWFSVCVMACLAGIMTKEVMVTAPLMVLLLDRTFVAGTFYEALRRRWLLYLALAAACIPLAGLTSGLHERAAGFGLGVAWWDYALTECRAIANYLALSFWPTPLVFDYGRYADLPQGGAWPYAGAVAVWVVAAVYALRRSPAVGLSCAWPLLILAPTSSVIPLAGQPIAEHRMYLPLAAVSAWIVIGAFRIAGRRSLPVLAGMAAVLALAAAARNETYKSALSLWSDTVAKAPENPRARNNLGRELEKLPGRAGEAAAEYEQALRLRPAEAEVHFNLANVLARDPLRWPESIGHYEQALRLDPDHAQAHNNLGNVLAQRAGRLAEAIPHYEEALRLRPDYPEAHNNLALAYVGLGRLEEAVRHLEIALKLKPDFPDASRNLERLRAIAR